jgi:hypothetical protein
MSEDKSPDSHLFKPGVSANPAGRPKDAINRPNLLKRSRELGIHPEDFLLYFAAGDTKKLKLEEGDISPNMRLKATIKALDKIVPDLKSVEFNAVNDEGESEGVAVRTVVVLPNNDRQTMDEASVDEIIALEDLENGMNNIIEAELLNESE